MSTVHHELMDLSRLADNLLLYAWCISASGAPPDALFPMLLCGGANLGSVTMEMGPWTQTTNFIVFHCGCLAQQQGRGEAIPKPCEQMATMIAEAKETP